MSVWIESSDITLPRYGHRSVVNDLEEFPAATRGTPTVAFAVVNDKILAQREGKHLIFPLRFSKLLSRVNAGGINAERL